MTKLIDASVEHQTRAAVAYVTDDRTAMLFKLMAAVVPAAGILAACAVMLTAVL